MVPAEWKKQIPLLMSKEKFRSIWYKYKKCHEQETGPTENAEDEEYEKEGPLEEIQPEQQFNTPAVQGTNLCLLDTSMRKTARGFGNLAPGFLAMGTHEACFEVEIAKNGGAAKYTDDTPAHLPSGTRSIRYMKARRDNQVKWQFFGNAVPLIKGQSVEMSCWIKFIDRVPPPSINFGFKHHLPKVTVDCSWLSTLTANQWARVSTTYEATETCMDFLLLIFDSLPQGQVVVFTDLQFVVSSLPPKVPPLAHEELNPTFDSEMY
uniref:Uncharacterized protein n=1 Tax=Octactis speculum TaxID=3111310 RepID=A0A7S2CF65_9STRA